MRAELEGKSIEELAEMREAHLLKMAGCLCSLLTGEIDSQGTKVKVRRWLRSLREVRSDLLEIGGLDSDLADTIQAAEKEADDFLFLPKRF